jgi:hypothetical protein
MRAAHTLPAWLKMQNKRGMMTFDVIVYAIIAVVILVVVLAFVFFGPLGKGFKQAKSLSEVTEGDITAAQNNCAQLCLQASNTDSEAFWPKSRYCTKMFAFDLDASGKIDDNEKSVHCWQDPILKDCRVRIGRVEVTHEKCTPT